jgi:hypothetical protein
MVQSAKPQAKGSSFTMAAILPGLGFICPPLSQTAAKVI